MRNLSEIRTEIDSIDEQIIELFKKRMDCAKEVGNYKKANNIPVLNQARENEILDAIEERGGEYGSYARLLYSNIMGYSVVPLRLSTYCGYFFSILSILGALAIVIRKLVNPAMALGWPSMMCAICFFSGLIMLFMGTIGEYLGRMFLGMNKQPQFVVREVITQNNAPDTEKTGINTSTVEESQTTSSSDIEKL